MGHANWRLDNPPVVDVGVSRRMGLFVVGRLAARHGVRVRLRHASSGGLTALVWLPDTVAAQEGAPLGRLRRFEAEDYGPSPSLSAPPAGAGGGALPSRTGFGQAGGAAAQAAAAARIPRFSPLVGAAAASSPQQRPGTGPQPVGAGGPGGAGCRTARQRAGPWLPARARRARPAPRVPGSRRDGAGQRLQHALPADERRDTGRGRRPRLRPPARPVSRAASPGRVPARARGTG